MRGAVMSLLAVLGTLALPVAAAQDSCDRQCLEDIAQRYLSALVAHDPARAPLAASVRITENGQNLGTVHGLWKTASADSKFRLYFVDPQHGAVGFIGLLSENDSPLPVALRLKVVHHMVTEAESIVARNTPFAKAAGFVAPAAVLLTDLKPADRVSRQALVRIADSYFTGLDTDHSGQKVPFDPQCQRREDGNVTANSADPKASAMQKLGCRAQFDTGFSVIVTKVRDRRYPIVDVERGLVYAEVFFDHSGTVASFRMDGKDVAVPADYRRPKTFQIGELFKIEKGQIRQIEAVLVDVPYGMKSGWGAPTKAPRSSVQAAAPAGCDHDCLVGFVDRYLAALLRHDPGKDLFTAQARFTENAQSLPLGQGLWQTASAGPQGYKLVIADPHTGNVGFYILMQENGNPVWLSGRLKVQAQRISELETAIVRKGVSFGKFDRTAISPLWNEILQPAEQRPRAALIAIANQYFDALDHHLVDSVPFADECFRVENGTQTAGPLVTPAAELAMGGAAPPPRAATLGSGPAGRTLPDLGHVGCRGNINSNMWQYITQIQPRRCEVADVERGVVQCIVLFHQDGEVPGTNVPGYGYLKYSGATRRPFDTLIPEMFKVRNGRIIEIEATMPSLPFGSTSGWESRSAVDN
jgi:hypothetical protein